MPCNDNWVYQERSDNEDMFGKYTCDDELPAQDQIKKFGYVKFKEGEKTDVTQKEHTTEILCNVIKYMKKLDNFYMFTNAVPHLYRWSVLHKEQDDSNAK